MVRITAACIAAVMLCSGCILTKEDLDCWYDDMCMTLGSDHAPAKPASPHDAQSLQSGR